jgi:hypothetical protein
MPSELRQGREAPPQGIIKGDFNRRFGSDGANVEKCAVRCRHRNAVDSCKIAGRQRVSLVDDESAMEQRTGGGDLQEA